MKLHCVHEEYYMVWSLAICSNQYSTSTATPRATDTNHRSNMALTQEETSQSATTGNVKNDSSAGAIIIPDQPPTFHISYTPVGSFPTAPAILNPHDGSARPPHPYQRRHKKTFVPTPTLLRLRMARMPSFQYSTRNI
jgi:hypothetical protein